MYKFNFIFLLLFFYACSEDGCGNGISAPIGQGVDIDEIISQRGKILPDACSIVPTREIAEILGKVEQEILLTNSTPRFENPTHSACFFKWEDPDYPNSGILIQAVRNPNESEYPDYISKWIASSKSIGEQGIEGDPVFFKDFEGFGDDGSYSTEAGKYYWRLGNKIYFMVAFNSNMDPEAQYKTARKIAYKLTKNYIEV